MVTGEIGLVAEGEEVVVLTDPERILTGETTFSVHIAVVVLDAIEDATENQFI